MPPEEIISNMLGARHCAYQALHSIFGVEPSEEQFEALHNELFHDAFETVFSYAESGSDWERLSSIVLNATFENTVSNEYIRAFVGPGDIIAPPWESVYVNPQPLLFQENTIEVRKMYLKQGLIPKRFPHEPDDHLAIELDFMEHLAKQAQIAYMLTEDDAFRESMDASAMFIDEHLGQWINAFAKRLENSDIDHYENAAKLLEKFIFADRNCIRKLVL